MALTQTFQAVLPELQAFLVLISRIGGLVAALPVLSGRAVPVKVKAALILSLGVLLAPLIRLPVVPYDPVALTAGLVGEMTIGLTIGLAVRMFFSALEIAGEMIGVQMGFGVVQLFDPTTALHTSIIGQYFTLLASLIFLSLNGHMLLVATILSSYEAIPVFGASVPAGIADDVLRLSKHMFIVAMKLAAPVLVFILLINILLAFLGRAVAQINVFVLSFPVTIAGGLAVLGLSTPFIVNFLVSEIERLELTIHQLLSALGHG